MLSLKQNQKRQNQVNINTYLDSTTQYFCDYIETHPMLYDGVELDSATIDYLNNYFYEYQINPKDFERHYIQQLRRCIGTYNNLKAVELNEKIFDITTNKTIRTLITQTTNNLSRTSNGTSKDTSSGTSENKGTTSDNSSSIVSGKQIVTESNDTQTATQQLPMNSKGDFDEMFEWDGGSNKTETKEDNGSTTTTNNTTTNTDNGTSNNTITTSNTINREDVNILKDIAEGTGNDEEITEVTGGQIVSLITNIWNYLVDPKSIDYLTEELKQCFILIY